MSSAVTLDAGSDPIITYTLFPHVTPTTKTERADVPWSELVGRITAAATYIDKRACPLISLAEYGDQPTDKGCIRHAANVIRIFGIEIDYDGEQIPPEEAGASLAKANLEAVIYTSPSHTTQRPRWRVLLPLSEPALPDLRAVYVGRVNRVLGGIASRESFTLSQSFYIGRVRGAEYMVVPVHGRTIDTAAEIEPLYFTGDGSNGQTQISPVTDAELRARFSSNTGGRYEAMLSLSSRWAARGMSAPDIEAALLDLLGTGNTTANADGIDLTTRAGPMARSAVAKFGETRAPRYREEPPLPEFAPPEVYADDYRESEPEPESDRPAAVASKIVLRKLSSIIAERREAAWLLDDILEQSVLAVIAGPRGTFKSFIALDWSMRIAMAGFPVVILSGEGAGLDRRADAWIKTHGNGVDPDELPVLALERPLNLNLTSELIELQAAFEAEQIVPALIVIDTFSKFSAGLDENNNSEVATYLSRLAVELRDRYRCTVLLVVHTGHGDAKRPRGASALMANPDTEYVINRPDVMAYDVTVSRERFKDCPAMPPLSYCGQVVDLGRLDRRGRPVTSLAFLATEAPPAVPAKTFGRNQERALAALAEWARASDATHITTDAITSLLKNQGLKDRRRRAEVLDFLVSAKVLTSSLGGYLIHREVL